jgi:hypothetical protein
VIDPHATTQERWRQIRDERRSNAVDRLGEAQQNASFTSGTLSAGTRVLDLATGIEGVIDRILSPAAPRPELVIVRLDNRAIVERQRVDLLQRPTPPTV